MKRLLTIIALFAGTQWLSAQPGYMGRKHVVSVEADINPVNSFTAGYGLMKQLSFHFEKVSSDRAGWVAGASAGFKWMSPFDIEHYGYMVNFVMEGTGSSSYEYLSPEGSIAYQFQEISLQRRWYARSIGAVPPYGIYIGFQTDITRLKHYDAEMKYFSDDANEYITFKEETPRANFAVSELMVIGNRRMISSRFTFASQVGVGCVLWQSSRPALITEENVKNYMDFEENMIVRHFASSKVLRLGIQLGYLF